MQKKIAQESCSKAEDDKRYLQDQLDQLQTAYETTLNTLQETQRRINPIEEDLNDYKQKCDKRVALEELEAAHKKVTDKLLHLSTRNVNKRIKRRDMDVSKLVSEKLALQEKLVESAALQNVKTDLEDAKAQLDETKSVCAKLEASVEKQRKERHSLVKKVWYRDKKVSKLKEDSCNEEDIAFYKNRAEFLDARVKELHQCIALCEDKTLTTYEDGRYTNTVRELIMELLSLNVSM